MENNYVAYVKAVGNYDGSATGGAYIILKGKDTYKISSKAQVNTIAYKDGVAYNSIGRLLHSRWRVCDYIHQQQDAQKSQ